MERGKATNDDAPGRRSSRRKLLAGAAGAAGVLAAEVLTKATPAQAGTDGDVVLGASNYETSETYVEFDASPSFQSQYGGAFWANAQDSHAYFGVVGTNFGASLGGGLRGGVAAVGDPLGVYAYSSSGEGIYAQAGSTSGTNPGGALNGVHGVTDSPTDSGVWGENVGAGYGIAGVTTSASGGPAGCLGQNGGAGPGVEGTSSSGDAVLGTTAGSGNAVHAQNTNPSALGYGVFGEHMGGGNGVTGQTNSTGKSGVWGNNLGRGPGVYGTSGTGSGVTGVGAASGAVGVTGTSTADGATGVQAYAVTSGGVALGVQGPSVFSLSGLASIAAGSKTFTVSGVSLRSQSLVLAMVQNNCGVYVKYVVPNVAGSSFSINLSKAVPAGKTAQVAWFVVN